MTAETIYTATVSERELAAAWHGGRSSMLYAVASTGALSRGTLRPAGADGPMTDPEWSDYLAWKLERELREVSELCRDGGDTFGRATADDWLRKLGTTRAALELEQNGAEQ